MEHKSDCGLHNEPYMPNTICTCGKANLTLAYAMPYLEHGLLITTKKLDNVWSVCGFKNETFILNGSRYPVDISDCVPILNPLSDFKSEILINGEMKKPWRHLGYPYESSLRVGVCSLMECLDAEYGESPTLNHNHFESYVEVNKFFEMQLDVYGLIDDGIAISFETAKNINLIK